MSIYFSSDHHFYHERIIEYCNRPFASMSEMNDVLMDNWNEVVKPDDTVYHLGDLTFKLDIVSKLSGNIILVRGNHDRGFSEARLLNAGIKKVYKLPTVFDIEGKRVLMCHAPLDKNLDIEADIYLCGHIHNRWQRNGKWYNVGVDVHNFYPITFEKILKGY